MHGFDRFEEDDGTVFRDVIMLALLGFVTVVVLLLPHLNPPTRTMDARQPGNLVVELHWPDNMNTDVDLWVEAPGDVPVGYSNQGGAVFNLLRDDMGHINDSGRLNYEIAFSRGAPAGEYTVNLHLYSNVDGSATIPAEVSVGVKKGERDKVQTIAKKRVDLVHPGQEVTVMRFTLDKDMNLVEGSLHDLPKPLRTAHANRRSGTLRP